MNNIQETFASFTHFLQMLTRVYPYLPTFISDFYIRKVTGVDDMPIAQT